MTDEQEWTADEGVTIAPGETVEDDPIDPEDMEPDEPEEED